MFHKLHYYDDFYLDDHFWDSVAGKGRIRKRGLTKAMGEMGMYGAWCYDKGLFLPCYEWCRSHGIVKSFHLEFQYKACVMKSICEGWRWDSMIASDDPRSIAVWDRDNPFDRLAVSAICHVDSAKRNYARFFFDETDGECDGYAIELASLFDMQMDMEELGSRTIYTFVK